MSGKNVLNTLAMEESFFSGTALIGISSPLPVYRLCWLFNEHMGTNFTRRSPAEDIELQRPKSEIKEYFPLYNYEIDNQGGQHFLYKLKSGNETLLPEIKQVDYVWLIESADAEAEADIVVQHIKTLPDILLAWVLEPDKLKHLNHLLV